MNPEIIKILEAGESDTAEFKGPRATLESLARAVCGMLNQQGGVLLWGISDQGEIVGLANARKRARELTDFIGKNLRPRPLVSIQVETAGRHQVVEVDVPVGADKPYSLRENIWIRLGERTLRATPAKSVELVERTVVRFDRWEREPMPSFSLSACSKEELARTRKDIATRNRFGVEVPQDDEDLIDQLNLSRRGQLTNGCVVLFAESPQRWAPNLTLRMTSSPSASRQAFDNDTVLDGPAVQMVQHAIDIVHQRTGFSGSFGVGSIVREDRPSYPAFALREGLVNAVVHRDYAELGDVRIEIYSDSLVIQNPGRLPPGWTPRDLRQKHASKPTNPDIARVFYLRGLMEQLGTGTQRLLLACREAGARSPIWEAKKGTVSLRLFRAPASAELQPRQSRFVEASQAGRVFVVGDYANFAEVSERQARRDLQDLKRAGVVKQQGRGRATRYRLLPQPESFDADVAQAASVQRYRETAPTTDKEGAKSVEAMVRWFFERYEDPANGVPYDGREGGYMYVGGGPYDAEEELRETFDDGTEKMDRRITAAAQRIQDDGWEWIKRGEY